MNDNFILYRSVKEFSFEIMKYSINVPKNMCYIRDGLQDAFINSIRLIRYYVVNMNESNRVKLKYLKDLIVELSMIDYYLDFLYTSRVLGKNRYVVFCGKLENVRKLAYGVISSEKKQCEV